MHSTIKSKITLILPLLAISLCACSGQEPETPVPENSAQALVILTDDLESTSGVLYRYEKGPGDAKWMQVGEKIPVVLGRSGLGWGRGLHDPANKLNFPVKREGDGRSPAGVFELSSVFGYLPDSQVVNLKMPYLHIDEAMECVDDVNSQHYNTIVSRTEIAEVAEVDWASSEKMRAAGIYYELGVVVEHNAGPGKNNLGSCIFLHNWKSPDETMAGCTAMEPANMESLSYWLDIEKHPILIQMTKDAYVELQKEWALPALKQQ